MSRDRESPNFGEVIPFPTNVQGIATVISTASTDHPGERLEPFTRPSAHWIALVGLELPGGTSLHPGVLRLADAALRQRGPVIEQRLDRLSLACDLKGITYDEAALDARDVAMQVSALVGVSVDAVTELDVQPMFNAIEALTPSCSVTQLPVRS